MCAGDGRVVAAEWHPPTVGWALDARTFWPSPYEGLNVGDSRASSERVVAVLIAHHAVSPDF